MLIFDNTNKNINRNPVACSGFTLIELLVVIAIIALLVSILLPSLNKAKALAKEAKAMFAMKKMLSGYNFYTIDNEGGLLFGFCPLNVNGQQIVVRDEASGYTIPMHIGKRYPWRIATYLENPWETMFNHTDTPDSINGSSDPEAFSKAYTMSVSVAFGYNSIFLGGHEYYDGFTFSGETSYPNRDGPAVFSENEVHRPGSMIVFADTQIYSRGISGGGSGFHTAMPPHAKGRKWEASNNGIQVLDTDEGVMGLPEGRYTSRTVTGFFDTHVEAMPPKELDDMKLWSNNATSDDYDYAK